MKFLTIDVASNIVVLWPIHPCAIKMLKAYDIWEMATNHPNVVLLKSLRYHDMLRLNMDARIMLTDSGGPQEECCILGTPCLTLRPKSQRTVTLREHGGASVLAGNNTVQIRANFNNSKSLTNRPELRDGHTLERIVELFTWEF
jgi:UDP-N-acetylglucosamine 2-epimerase (non-hydrolysing)